MVWIHAVKLYLTEPGEVELLHQDTWRNTIPMVKHLWHWDYEKSLFMPSWRVQKATLKTPTEPAYNICRAGLLLEWNKSGCPHLWKVFIPRTWLKKQCTVGRIYLNSGSEWKARIYKWHHVSRRAFPFVPMLIFEDQSSRTRLCSLVRLQPAAECGGRVCAFLELFYWIVWIF